MMMVKRAGFVILVCFLFVACAPTAMPTIGPAPEPTATMAVTTTLTPEPLPTETLTPTNSPTPTAIPTLSVDAARARLLELLANNGGCRLPCLWGIVLGESTYHEAQATLLSLSSISEITSFSPKSGAMFPIYTEGNLQIFTTIGFITNLENSIVNHIAFNAEAHKPLAEGGYENVFDSKFFGDKVSTYMLPHVLSEQGVPSSVMISTFGGPLTRGGTGGFDILLLCPNQGILVNYTTQMRLVGSKVLGCPGNAHVEMELYPPGQPDLFFGGLKQTDWAVKMDGYKPLEEVTSMSATDFHDAFRQPTSKCIETPAKLWPTPEP